MQITLESDYAVRIVSCLVKNEGKRLDGKTIADSTGVTLRFALKILRNLVSSGIVISYKGANGGYELAKSPSEITMLDVIETVEGPCYFSRCLSGEYDCNCTDLMLCKARHIFAEITENVRNTLKSTTFDILNK